MAINLADIIGNVSGMDTNREQIEYIGIDMIVPDENNFYELTNIDELANSILLCGLQQPLRVRQMPGDESQVVIISGHRRYTALKKLVEEGHEEFRDVMCIVETKEEPEALTQLKLIMANSDTRVLKSPEISVQAERIEKLLYELQQQGYKFPGRMRDYVAQICQVSASKLARLKVIREKLDPKLLEKWQNHRLSESVAYLVAQQPPEVQKLCGTFISKATIPTEYSVSEYIRNNEKLDGMQCPKTKCACSYTEELKKESARHGSLVYCGGCCRRCQMLIECPRSCPEAADLKTAKVKKAEEQKQQQEAERMEFYKPQHDFAQVLWSRIRERLDAEGKTLRQLCEANHAYYNSSLQGYIDQPEQQDGFNPYLPSGLSGGMYISNAMDVAATADFLGCSVDYLLGRTSSPWPYDCGEIQLPPQGWQTGNPETDGRYLCRIKRSDGATVTYFPLLWRGGKWFGSFGKVTHWIPEVEE